MKNQWWLYLDYPCLIMVFMYGLCVYYNIFLFFIVAKVLSGGGFNDHTLDSAPTVSPMSTWSEMSTPSKFSCTYWNTFLCDKKYKLSKNFDSPEYASLHKIEINLFSWLHYIFVLISFFLSNLRIGWFWIDKRALFWYVFWFFKDICLGKSIKFLKIDFSLEILE